MALVSLRADYAALPDIVDDLDKLYARLHFVAKSVECGADWIDEAAAEQLHATVIDLAEDLHAIRERCDLLRREAA